MHFNFVCPTVSVDKTSPMGEPMALCSIFMNHSQFSSVSPSAGRLLGGASVGVNGAGVGRCGRVVASVLASPSKRKAAAGCVGSCCWQRRRHGAAPRGAARPRRLRAPAHRRARRPRRADPPLRRVADGVHRRRQHPAALRRRRRRGQVLPGKSHCSRPRITRPSSSSSDSVRDAGLCSGSDSRVAGRRQNCCQLQRVIHQPLSLISSPPCPILHSLRSSARIGGSFLRGFC